MVQPGVYGSAGAVPCDAQSWIEFVKEGRGDAAALVRAITLIFQKRGYKWDAIALGEMSDVKLKDFLLTARMPTGDASLAEQVRAQLQKRKDDPEDPVRGKPKVSVEELESLVALACKRGELPARPRLAEHRSVKEAELKAVIEGFETASGLGNDVSDRWKKELCGLLNKVLRPARFENRLKTGCAWCGKATPRKARVREIAYRAAVQNLRIREGFRTRPLKPEEQAPFLAWWQKPEDAPGTVTIANRLKKLNSGQEKMARQLYDLLKNPNAKGRASLCIEHLEMAAEGKTMKDAGVPWQRIAVRKAPNPCGEARDARVLKRLESLLFQPKRHGDKAWRYGPAAFINLEIPEPDTFQLRPGQQAERKVVPLKERLAQETGGCTYGFLGGCAGEMDKDHIFPRSLGGPDVLMNLVAACNAHNAEKGNRTPCQWLHGPDSLHWKLFQEHVRNLPLAEAKKRILLSLDAQGNHTDDYPEDDPTPLARIGARPRQFVVKLGELFARYGVEPPRIYYELGKPLMQRIRGSETHWFRLSFHKTPDGEINFPYPKDRTTLFNHAEDAAILAAVPPHTWRATTRVHTAKRPLLDGNEGDKSGLVVPELAPDWAAFLETRSRPIVYILGRSRVSWRNKFADLTFWREPLLDTPRIKRTKLLRDIQRKDFKNIFSPFVRSTVEEIAESVGLGEKGTLLQALARKLAGAGAKGKEVEQRLPAAAEELERRYPGLRRLQVFSQKGGTLALVNPADGPPRKVQIKPASEGVVVWQIEEGKKRKALKTHISVIRPMPLLKFGFPRIDEPLPEGAKEIGRLLRHQIIWLDAEPDRPAGFYRVTKCQQAGVTVVPEELVPAEIARRMQVASAQATAASEEEEAGKFVLGKQELAEYFAREGRE